MYTSIARGEVSNARYPAISTFVLVGGVLVDPAALEYVIYERVTDDVRTRVFPELAGTRAAVDLVHGRLGLGYYAAMWEAGLEAQVGIYEVDWYFRLASEPLVEFSFTDRFEVITAKRMLGPQYAFVADMREEGVREEDVPDALLQQKIVIASKLFELYTGRTFEARARVMQVNGRGHGALLLDDPIIAISGVGRAGVTRWSEMAYEPVSANLRIYNRHVTGLRDPDDREDPRIEYEMAASFDSPRFGEGRQNTLVEGVFGYTEYVEGGPPAGVTPVLVRQAVKLMTFKDLRPLTDIGARDDAQKRWRLTGETTREQGYTTLGGVDAATRGALVGGTTGDPEIDNLIILFRRPSRAVGV